MRWLRRRTVPPQLSPLAEALSVPEPLPGWHPLPSDGTHAPGATQRPPAPAPAPAPSPPPGFGTGSGLLGVRPTDRAVHHDRVIDLDDPSPTGRALRSLGELRHIDHLPGTRVDETVVVVRRETSDAGWQGTSQAVDVLGDRVDVLLCGLERVDRHLDEVDAELAALRGELRLRPDRVEVVDVEQHCRRLDADLSRLRVELRGELQRGLHRLGGDAEPTWSARPA
jgi:hypothetical protein